MNKSLIRSWTIITDIILFNLAFITAYLVRYELQLPLVPTFRIPYTDYLGQQTLLTLLLIIAFSQNQVWQRRRGEFFIDELSRVGYATATAIALMMAITFFFRPLAFSRFLLIWALLFINLFIAIGRLLRRMILNIRYRQGKGVDRVLIVGCGETGRGVMRTLLARPDLGYQPIGYLDDGYNENNMGLERIPHLGNLHNLSTILASNPNLHTVFVALPANLHNQVLELVDICRQHQTQPQVVPDLFQLGLNHVESSSMAGIPILTIRELNLSQAGQRAKRVIDLVLVALATGPALLITLILAIAIKLESPGPIFYSQERVGRFGKQFRMFKFRSMVVNADDQKGALQEMNEASGPIFKIKNDPRLTRVGRLIRRLSLDELPQLLNIWRGEMSLVGPRPPLPEEVAQYQPWHTRRLEVKGGLTGLWQISGRSDLTFDEGCLLDIYYIENWSLALDMRLILQTIPYLISGRGAY